MCDLFAGHLCPGMQRNIGLRSCAGNGRRQKKVPWPTVSKRSGDSRLTMPLQSRKAGSCGRTAQRVLRPKPPPGRVRDGVATPVSPRSLSPAFVRCLLLFFFSNPLSGVSTCWRGFSG